MKTSQKLLTIAAVLAITSTTAICQRVQSLPDNVTDICVENSQRLYVRQGETSRIVTNSARQNIASLVGTRLKISTEVYDSAILYIAPNRNLSFRAEDYAGIVFEGSFMGMDTLQVSAEDYSTVRFEGEDTDTVSCISLKVRCEDFAKVLSSSIMQAVETDFSVEDFSTIEFAGLDYRQPQQNSETKLRASVSDFARIYTGRTTGGDSLLYDSKSADDVDAVNKMVGRLTDVLLENYNAKYDKVSSKRKWYDEGGEFDFAWGWHNWGNEPFVGFGGVDGANDVNTTFNNIQLSFKKNLVACRWVGFYVGLGLEWDKWKFATPEVVFSTTNSPYSFEAGSSSNGNTMLTTRYVVVPLSIRLGDKDKVHCEISVIPGIHWNASGLRYKHSPVVNKDRSINKYINPYKLDLRATLYYGKFGVYAQVSTLSTFKNTCEDLFPVKFGFTI